MIGCTCPCHNHTVITMDACGGWGPPCCSESYKSRAELREPPELGTTVQHTTIGGKGVVARIGKNRR